MPEALEFVSHFTECSLRPISETKQSFFATQSGASLGHAKHIIGCHCPRALVAGVLSKSTVATVVAAEVGQRYENFSRIGDDSAFEAVPQQRSLGHQQVQFIARPGADQ